MPTKGHPAQPWDLPSGGRGLEAQRVQLRLGWARRQAFAPGARWALPELQGCNTLSNPILAQGCRWPANTSVSECSSLNHGFTDYFWTILLDRSLGTYSQIFIILSRVNLIFIDDYTIFSLYPGMELVDGVEKRQLGEASEEI